MHDQTLTAQQKYSVISSERVVRLNGLLFLFYWILPLRLYGLLHCLNGLLLCLNGLLLRLNEVLIRLNE